MSGVIKIEPLSPGAFSPFGDVLDASGEADVMINHGMCGRFNDRAKLDFGPEGRAGISVFKAKARTLPLALEMVERHPEGCQAFIPMTEHSFLVVVAPDENDAPGTPRAFLTAPGQGVNLHRGVWHGVLTPLREPGLFAVVDRIGKSQNLEEYWFKTQYMVQ